MFVPINIVRGNTQREKDFIPLTFFDLPVELIAKDGTYYMLWIIDEDAGEWWFVTELNNPSDAIDYVEGKISALDMLKNRGITKVVFRPDSDYLTINWDDGMSLEKAQQELNLLLPTENSYLELWDDEKGKILSILHGNVKRISKNPFAQKRPINPEAYLLIAYKPNITISFDEDRKNKPTSYIRQPFHLHQLGLSSLKGRLSGLANKSSQELKHGQTILSA